MGEWRQLKFDAFSFLGRQPKIVVTEVVPKEPKSPGIRTTLSQMEILVRYLKGEPFPTYPSEKMIESEGVNTSIETGLTLHVADTICSVLAQNMSGMVKAALPTATNEQRSLVSDSVKGLHPHRDKMNEQEYLNAFQEAWSRYFNDPRRKKPATYPLIEGMGFQNPKLLQDTLFSQELWEKGVELTQLWGEAAYAGNYYGEEFAAGRNTVSEVLVLLHIPGAAVLLERIDKLTVPDYGQVEIVNFKTGKLSNRSEDREISRRQALTELLIAQLLLSKVDTIDQLHRPRNEPYQVTLETDLDGRKTRYGDSLFNSAVFYYRFFESGKMYKEPLRVGYEEMQEHKNWLLQYAVDLKANKDEITRAKRKAGLR